MENEPDYPALRNLLALKRLEMPLDTEVNRFLIEFHRRQRATLLAPKSHWSRAVSWIFGLTEGFPRIPSLSYASGLAALTMLAFAGLSQQVSRPQADGQYKLSLRLPTSESTMAMVPVSFARDSSPKADGLTFNPAASRTGATRFVLANTRVAYDATAAF